MITILPGLSNGRVLLIGNVDRGWFPDLTEAVKQANVIIKGERDAQRRRKG